MSEELRHRHHYRGLEALSVVLQHEECDELDQLRAEVQELRILQALQMETAVHQDIHYWFAKVNDPEDPTCIETLQQMRDYILAHSVDINTVMMQASTPCRFSFIGGHYELMSSVLAACQRYEQAVATKEGSVKPEDWQWEPFMVPAQLCAAQCLNLDHLHVEPRTITATRYRLVEDFPTSLVEAVARGQDPKEVAQQRFELDF